MFGLMQDRPLLISSLIDYAATFHPKAEVVGRTVEGPVHRTNYAEIQRRAKQYLVEGATTRSSHWLGDHES